MQSLEPLFTTYGAVIATFSLITTLGAVRTIHHRPGPGWKVDAVYTAILVVVLGVLVVEKASSATVLEALAPVVLGPLAAVLAGGLVFGPFVGFFVARDRLA